MTDFFDDLERELRWAHRRDSERHPSSRVLRRLLPVRPATVLPALVALVVVVALVAVVVTGAGETDVGAGGTDVGAGGTDVQRPAAPPGKKVAPRVTLTDKSCTYSGARTHEPGPFEIEAENTTPHVASFAVYELAPGFSIKDVRGFFQRLDKRGQQEVKPPTPDDFRRNETWGHAGPRATTLLPVNASAGRFVIVCMENTSADTQPSGGVWPDPKAIYVPAQLEIR